MLPCSTTKTLVINYASASGILPAGGYTIQWRAVGNTTWNTVSNKTANPITIPNVPTCYSIEGKILADCGDGVLNELETFAVTGISTTCSSYQLIDTGDYTYTPCNEGEARVIYNNETLPQTVCAVEGSVTGGQFTRIGACV